MPLWVEGIGVVNYREHAVLKRWVYKMRDKNDRTKWFREHYSPVGWGPQHQATLYTWDEVLTDLKPVGAEWVAVGKIIYSVE